jgi:hypothetical protein
MEASEPEEVLAWITLDSSKDIGMNAAVFDFDTEFEQLVTIYTAYQ